MNELMLDFETLGTDSDTIVLSLGACFFDLQTKQIGPKTFYVTFDVESQIENGRTFSKSTLEWWMNQSDAAKRVFKENPTPTKQALGLLLSYIEYNCPDLSKLKVWGNGATFDISILESLLKEYKLPILWKYSNVMDFRTFKRFVAKDAKIDRASGTHHNAVDDAINQATFVLKHG